MNRSTFVLVAIGLLVTSLTVPMHVFRLRSATVEASSGAQEVGITAEYSNGSIGDPMGVAFWYDWVNTNVTQLISLAYYSEYYNSPVLAFLGQHFVAENGTEIFVGNTLSSMEVYNDTNGNGLPDADFTSGTSEILYNFIVNSSVRFVPTEIQKAVVKGVSHYTWGVRHETIDGFLIGEQVPDAKVMLDYMTISYDFYIENNISYVKTNFSVGDPLEIVPFGDANVTLEGLSLSLLYGTMVITSKPYVAMVNEEPYNSTTAPTPVKPADSGEIRIEDNKAYEFLFGQNYTLYRDSQMEVCESKSAAVANRSVSDNARTSVEWLLYNLEDVLSELLPKISSMQVAIDLDYSVSSFIYRVCYPSWGGCKLEHDPVYVAYLGGLTIPEISPPLMLVVAAAIIGTVTLATAVIDLRKTRRLLKAPAETAFSAFQR